MRTAFTSWKLAKGLYIIPVIMAYHPLLLNGPTWAVVQTIVFSVLSITAFVVCLERYFMAPLNWIETIGFGAAALALIWADDMTNYLGCAVFLLFCGVQLFKRQKEKTKEAGTV